jgi:hypothetical protein
MRSPYSHRCVGARPSQVDDDNKDSDCADQKDNYTNSNNSYIGRRSRCIICRHIPGGRGNGKEIINEVQKVASFNSFPEEIINIIREYAAPNLLDIELFFEDFDYLRIVKNEQEKKSELSVILVHLPNDFLEKLGLRGKLFDPPNSCSSDKLDKASREKIWSWLEKGSKLINLFKGVEQKDLVEMKNLALTYCDEYYFDNYFQETKKEDEKTSYNKITTIPRLAREEKVEKLMEKKFYNLDDLLQILKLINDYILIIFRGSTSGISTSYREKTILENYFEENFQHFEEKLKLEFGKKTTETIENIENKEMESEMSRENLFCFILNEIVFEIYKTEDESFKKMILFAVFILNKIFPIL